MEWSSDIVEWSSGVTIFYELLTSEKFKVPIVPIFLRKIFRIDIKAKLQLHWVFIAHKISKKVKAKNKHNFEAFCSMEKLDKKKTHKIGMD